MKTLRVVLPALAILASVARAQSAPPITKAKQSAQRAVAATNAHTAAMTNVPSTEPKADTSTQTPPAKSDSTTPRVEKDSAAGSTAVTKRAERPAFEREVFVYSREGRRDPFVSLMSSSDLRPLLSDLKLTGIAYDPTGRNSVAVLRDVNSKEQYRVRVGQSLGRMRVANIGTKSITFTIEEFGYSRQESLALVDSKKERTQ